MRIDGDGLGCAADAISNAGPTRDPGAVHARGMPSTRGRRVVLALLASVFAVHFLDRQLLAMLIPPIKAELGLSDTALGFLSGFAFTAFFSTAGLLIARLSDRSDRARIITWSLAAFSLMTALCGMATTFWQLLAARIGVGAGEGGTNPASHSLIADIFPPSQRATAMAIYSIGSHLGLILAFGVGGWLAQTYGWRTAFLMAGLLGFGVALATRIGLEDPRARLPRTGHVEGLSAAAAVSAIIRSPTLLHLFAAGTLGSAVATAAVTWLPALLIRTHHLTLAESGVFLALAIGVAGAVGTYACGRITDVASISDARQKVLVPAALQCVVALSLPLALVVESRMAALLLLTFPCVLLAGFIGPTLAVVQDLVDPRARAFSAAILLFLANLVGAGFGPLAVGVLSDVLASTAGAESLRYAMLVIPLLCLWSAFHYWRASPTLVAELRK